MGTFVMEYERPTVTQTSIYPSKDQSESYRVHTYIYIHTVYTRNIVKTCDYLHLNKEMDLTSL